MSKDVEFQFKPLAIEELTKDIKEQQQRYKAGDGFLRSLIDTRTPRCTKPGTLRDFNIGEIPYLINDLMIYQCSFINCNLQQLCISCTGHARSLFSDGRQAAPSMTMGFQACRFSGCQLNVNTLLNILQVGENIFENCTIHLSTADMETLIRNNDVISESFKQILNGNRNNKLVFNFDKKDDAYFTAVPANFSLSGSLGKFIFSAYCQSCLSSKANFKGKFLAMIDALLNNMTTLSQVADLADQVYKEDKICGGKFSATKGWLGSTLWSQYLDRVKTKIQLLNLDPRPAVSSVTPAQKIILQKLLAEKRTTKIVNLFKDPSRQNLSIRESRPEDQRLQF